MRSQQQFEILRTDNDHVQLQSQTNRSLIKSIELDSHPINELTPSHKPTQHNHRVQDLIVSTNKYVLAQSRKSFTNLQAGIGPKFEGEIPKQGMRKDDSPKLMDEDSEDVPIEGFSNEVWKYYALEIMMLILRFISFITKANFATSFRLVTKRVFDIIDDKAAYFKMYYFQNVFKYEKPTRYELLKYKINMKFFIPLRRLSFYRYIHRNKLILRPESLLSIGWNIYILTILNMNVLYVSTRVAFKFDTGSDFGDGLTSVRQIFFDVLPSYSFLLEILLKFNTCYYRKGSVVENRYLIAKNYLKNSFFFDVFVIIPFFLSLRFQVDYLDLVLILKVFQIQKFSGNLFDRLELSANQIALFDLIKLGYTILAAAHFCACLWFLVGSTGDPSQPSWVTVQNIQDENWVSQYFHSFYFSIVTMTTIGYGDITPQNLRERIFTIGMAVAAVGTFGYSIGNINNIYAEWSRKSYQFRSDMNQLKKYMRVKKINKNLSERIRKYFEYIWTDQSEEDFKDATKFEDMIPPQLVEEMRVDMYLKVLKNVPFLRENFNEQILIGLCRLVKEQKYVPEQVIYQQGEPSERLYILIDGGIQLYLEMGSDLTATHKIMESINKEGTAFGQAAFFQNQCFELSCKSTQFSYILSFSREDFLELLQTNHKQYEIYCQLRDEVSFNGKKELIGTNCRACNKTQHNIKDCPMVCGYPNRSKVLLNYRRNIPSDRKANHQRCNLRKIRTRKEINDIQNSIYLFISRSQLLREELEDAVDQFPPTESDFTEASIIINDVGEQLQSQRYLSFQACNDVLQDEQIQERIKEVATHIKTMEKHFQKLKNEKTLLPIHVVDVKQRRNSQLSSGNELQVSPKQINERQNTKLNPTLKFDYAHPVLKPSNSTNDMVALSIESDQQDDQDFYLIPNFDRLHIFAKYMRQNNFNQIKLPKLTQVRSMRMIDKLLQLKK